MDIRKIKKLIDLLNESGIAEIEICEGEESLRISRLVTPTMPAIPSYLPIETMPHAAQISRLAAPLPAAATTAESALESTIATKPTAPKVEAYTVKSPMVGTVYLAPQAGAEQFVRVGKRVEPTTVVCIVEAMKMFNQIEAGKAGVISACLVENEQPVEYDQPLFLIEE